MFSTIAIILSSLNLRTQSVDASFETHDEIINGTVLGKMSKHKPRKAYEILLWDLRSSRIVIKFFNRRVSGKIQAD